MLNVLFTHFASAACSWIGACQCAAYHLFSDLEIRSSAHTLKTLQFYYCLCALLLSWIMNLGFGGSSLTFWVCAAHFPVSVILWSSLWVLVDKSSRSMQTTGDHIQSAGNQIKEFFARLSGNTHFPLVTRGCQCVTYWSLGQYDWGFSNWFSGDRCQLPAIACQLGNTSPGHCQMVMDWPVSMCIWCLVFLILYYQD